MATLVLTVIGDDRAGLVQALAEVVNDHGGNWSRSQLAELSGTFAGIVEIGVDDARADELVSALRPLAGLLNVTVQTGHPEPGAAGDPVVIELVGNDRPGIVAEVTTVVRDHGLSIDLFESAIVDAPMGGGQLFTATVRAHADEGSDVRAAVVALQALADELMVDLEVR